VRVAALNIQGEWHNLLTHVRLDSKPLEQIERHPYLPETEKLSCWQEILPIRELESLLEDILNAER
jgi:hypothetical protein